MSVPGLRSCRREPPKTPGKEVGTISQTNLSGRVSLEGACLFVCTLKGWQKPLRAGGDRLRSLEPKCLAFQGWGGRSFQMGKKALPMPSLPSTPTPDFPFPQLWGHFSALRPSQPPTYLFPFLDFIFHGESSLLLLPPYWPPLPLSPPTQLLCSFSCLVGNSTSPGVPAPPV